MRRSVFAFRAAISAVLTLLLVALALPTAVSAATPGITSEILLNGQTYNGTDVVNEGDEITLRVQYSTDVEPGSTVDFELGPNVTVSGVPQGNSAIESVAKDGNKVAITFKDPWPSDVNQGVFDIKFTVNSVEGSTPGTITWKIDDAESSVDVIIRDDDDNFSNITEKFEKSVAAQNLGKYISVVDGRVQVSDDIKNEHFRYTLKVDSPEARSGNLTDTLPAGMAYDAGSFSAQLTTWDSDGLNQQTNPYTFAPTVTGQSFTGAIDVPGPSSLAISYTAAITDVTAIRDQLQAKYDALNGNSGGFNVELTNTATFDGKEAKATIRIGSSIAGVNIGQAFSKWADWTPRVVETADDGVTLDPPADITYHLKADLRQWVGGQNFTLGRNVVIVDTLPDQASWNTTAADFITADGITLTKATTAPADANAFAADSYVGQYWVSGQQLLINVGKDNTTNAVVHAKATINTLDGLPNGGDTSIVGAESFLAHNAAAFYYKDGSPHWAGHDAQLITVPDDEGGTNDSSVFTKTGHAQQEEVNPGDTVKVDYSFKVAAGKGIDVAKSKIVDYVDPELFDISDLDAINPNGSYAGQALDASHFALSVDDEGNLVIELSDAGKAVVEAKGTDKEYKVNITLTSVPFEGKETKELTNKATLFGEDEEPIHWSDTEADATSFGDEAEVRKRIYDPEAQAWVESLPAPMNDEGGLVEDTYVYRVEFIPHGSYNNVKIIDVHDLMPEHVEFLGFVQANDIPAVENPTTETVDIGGNIEASYDAEAGTVTLSQKEGTLLQAGNPIQAYLGVKITPGFDPTQPIVNRIDDTEAEIVPEQVVSVGDYVWVDANRDGLQDDSDVPLAGVTVTLTGPDGGPVTDVFGEPVESTVTDDKGWYTFDGLPALTGDQTYTVVIDQEASAEVLEPYTPTVPNAGARDIDSDTWQAVTEPGDLHDNGDRDPTLDFGFVEKNYAIGDIVWIDTNKDGLQSEGEAPLPGVTVELLDADGEVVGTTTTDDAGRYAFDQLDDGTYQVRFTLTDEQQQKYLFTSVDSGDDTLDSDATPAADNPGQAKTIQVVLDDSNTALTLDYEPREIKATQGIDPTWDAGVVLKTVSVGDYVWVDTNRDGIQDEGETPIPGVTLVLEGPDGEPVTDVFGNPVEPTVTDDEGLYTFDNLPALTGDQTYTVVIDQEASAEVLKPYVPTAENVGDRDKDSDTWEAVTEPGDLHDDGDRDPTLDFGFQLKSYAIGDYVWVDTNRDGLQSEGEEPLEGVKVELLDGTGEFLDETTTDEQGLYLFDELLDGDYQIRFTLTEDQATKYIFTTLDSGDDAADSDAVVSTENPAEGVTIPVTLNDGNAALTTDYDAQDVVATQGIDPTWDSGVVLKKVTVGDYVWVDEDRDGAQDEGETPIPGVTLVLEGPDGEPVTDVFGNPVEPTVTDENGLYLFEDLPALTGEDVYTVKVDQDASAEVLKPYVPTLDEIGEDRAIDSSTWEESTVAGELSEDGAEDLRLDFGFQRKSYAIGDITWVDLNKNGVQDSGEEPLAGVAVDLLDDTGAALASTTTDAEGLYNFDDLAAGEYQIRFTLTEEQKKIYEFTSLDSGSDDALDSDANPADGLTIKVVLDDSNAALTTDYTAQEISATQGIDPTWDAGVVITDAPPIAVPKRDLPTTGSAIGAPAIGGAIALLVLGGIAVYVGRRRAA